MSDAMTDKERHTHEPSSEFYNFRNEQHVAPWEQPRLFKCDCHRIPPTYPVYRNKLHVAPCPKADTEALIDGILLPLIDSLRTGETISEEVALNLMDRLEGWCSPENSLRPKR